MRIRRGFSLTELLIVVAILAILTVALFATFTKQRDAAGDAKSKADLHRLKVAFEDYYGDHNCYPPADWFDEADDCGSNNLRPYLSSIPCDARTGLPYVIETDDTTCKWFKAYAMLKQPDETQCDNYNGSTQGNYGVSSDNTKIGIICEVIPSPMPSPTPTASPTTTPTPSPGSSSTPSPSASATATPTPTPTPSAAPEGNYYCSSIGHCQEYVNTTWTCTPNYFSEDCNGACNTSTGSCIHD